MKDDFSPQIRVLSKDGIDRIEGKAGRRIECIKGMLWITQDGDLRDIVIGGGESFVLDRRGRTLAMALADSHYMVLEPAGADPIRPQ